jgi:hypothetical protein
VNDDRDTRQIIEQYQPISCSLEERQERIIQLLSNADRFQWEASLEIWEIKRTNAWRQALGTDGEPCYDDWDSYLQDLSEKISRSRRWVFARMEIIKHYIEGMQMSMEELMERSPTGLQELSTLVNWNRRTGEPIDGVVTVDEFKTLVDETEQLRVADIKALVEEKRGERRILFFGSIRPAIKDDECWWQIRVVNEEGEVFLTDIKMSWPRELVRELGRRLGIQWDETDQT